MGAQVGGHGCPGGAHGHGGADARSVAAVGEGAGGQRQERRLSPAPAARLAPPQA
ncbi:MAG: hypothetical protein U0531_09165 [Dehalococcoidia bacterium]